MSSGERRAWPRDAPEILPFVARVRSGHEVFVVDVSFGGVLIEAPVRLAPASTVDLRLAVGNGIISVKGQVVRCYVSSLGPEAIRYRAALAFDKPVHLPVHSQQG